VAVAVDIVLEVVTPQPVPTSEQVEDVAHVALLIRFPVRVGQITVVLQALMVVIEHLERVDEESDCDCVLDGLLLSLEGVGLLLDGLGSLLDGLLLLPLQLVENMSPRWKHGKVGSGGGPGKGIGGKIGRGIAGEIGKGTGAQ
jgi:hypothetical protein